ncbi:MAG: glycine betaine ABC transporter substrate-binding protein [Actinomycetota bacterium]
MRGDPVRSVRIGVLGAALAISIGACEPGGGAGGGGSITIGAVSFAENLIVAEMYALVLEDAGYDVDRRFNFENREELQPELRSGGIDLAPEYLASLLIYLDPDARPSSDPQDNVDRLEPLLEDRTLTLLEPSEANDTNALVVTGETAGRYDLEKVSDLEPVAGEMTLGGPRECPERRFCLEGLRDVYDLDFARFVPLDINGPLTVAALATEEIDVALLFSTSPVIAERDWILLEDDRELQAAENITPVIRSDASTEEVEELLDQVSDAITTNAMMQLNAAVQVENRGFTEVARGFLAEEELLEGG